MQDLIPIAAAAFRAVLDLGGVWGAVSILLAIALVCERRARDKITDRYLDMAPKMVTSIDASTAAAQTAASATKDVTSAILSLAAENRDLKAVLQIAVARKMG